MSIIDNKGQEDYDEKESVADTDDDLFSNSSPNGVATIDIEDLEALAASKGLTLTPNNASEQAARIDQESKKIMKEMEERNTLLFERFQQAMKAECESMKESVTKTSIDINSRISKMESKEECTKRRLDWSNDGSESEDEANDDKLNTNPYQ